MKLKQNKTILVNMLSTILLQGLAFFSAPLFSRMLGTDNYGIVSVYNTWVSMAAIIGFLSVQGTLGMSFVDYDEDERFKYQSSILFLGTVIYLLFTTLAVTFFKPIDYILNIGFLSFGLGLIQGYGQGCLNFMNSKNIYEFKAHNNLIITFITSFSSIILSIGLITRLPKDINYYGRMVGYAIPHFIIGIGAAAVVLIRGKSFFVKEYWHYCIPICFPIVFHTLSNLILNQSDRIMLQNMGTNKEVGIYSLAYNFGSIITVIYGALNNSWAPFYMNYMKHNQIIELKTHARNYVRLFTVISIGFLYLQPEVYSIFADKSYWDGNSLIPIFVVGFYLMFLYSFAVNHEFYYKKTKIMALVTVFSAICNITLNYFFIKRIGMMGAALASSLSFGIEFILHYMYAKNCIHEGKFHFNLQFFLPYSVAFLFFYSLFYLLRELWMIRWGIGIMIGIYQLNKMIKGKTIF